MKKLIKVLLVITILITVNGCMAEERDIDTIIADTIKESLQTNISHFTNINKDYYQFYLPKDVGRKKGDVASNILTYKNNDLVMCINMPNVIKDYFYNEVSVDNEESRSLDFGADVVVKEYKGTYVDYGNRTVDYEVIVITVDQGLYFMQMSTRYLSFGAVLYKNSIGPMLAKMIEIARTVRISYELIAIDFSNREIYSSSSLQALDLFKSKKPSSGYLIDLINPKTKDDEEEKEVDE